MDIDTSAETVKRLIIQIDGIPAFAAHNATLCALVAERDRLREARNEAIKIMSDMARQAGSWQGIAEGKDVVIRQLETERDRLRAGLMRVIQYENGCDQTGRSCDASKKCGCSLEADTWCEGDRT